MRRLILWIIGGILIVGISVIVLFMRTTKMEPQSAPAAQRQTVPNAQPAASSETVYTAEAIARSTNAFLTRQRRSDNFYHFFSHYETVCPEASVPDSCPLAGRNVMEQANAWTILGRLAYYRMFSRDRADLAIAAADAQALTDYCAEKGNTCPMAPLAIGALYEETRDEAYRVMLTALAPSLSDTSNLDMVGLTFQARSLLALANVFPDSGYADLARQRLRQAQDQEAQDRKEIGGSPTACYLTLAQIEAAETFGSFSDLEEVAAGFHTRTLAEMPSSTSLRSTCAESALILGELLSNEQIQETGEKLLEQLVVERWDEPGYPRLWGEGGFLYEDTGTAVTVADAGHMLWILSGRSQHIYRFANRENI